MLQAHEEEVHPTHARHPAPLKDRIGEMFELPGSGTEARPQRATSQRLAHLCRLQKTQIRRQFIQEVLVNARAEAAAPTFSTSSGINSVVPSADSFEERTSQAISIDSSANGATLAESDAQQLD